MSRSILVVYASEFGTTREIAEEIGQMLSDPETHVDVRQIFDVRDLAPYDAAVVGSAIYNGAWLPEAVDFLRFYEAMLSAIPVAYFVVSMTMRSDTPANRQTVLEYLSPLQRAAPTVHPVHIGLFAGRMNYHNLPLLLRVYFWFRAHFPSGDFRNRSAIQKWVRQIRPALIDSKRPETGSRKERTFRTEEERKEHIV